MALKLSIFTTITNPYKRGDNFADAYKCYIELADEVIIVNGARNAPRLFSGKHKNTYVEWPQEFKWPLIGQQFQQGYKVAIGDWVIHADIDFIFHQKDFGKIRQALRDYPNSPAISFYKWQFILPDRYNLKSRLLLAVNKKAFGDRITFSGGGDLCQPQLDGKDLELSEMPQAGVPFYNYEKLTKTKQQIMDDVGRMDRAYFRHFRKALYSGYGEKLTNDEAFGGWVQMMIGRFRKPSAFIKLNEHPKYIQETIRNLRPDQFGFSGFGELEVNRYAQGRNLS